MITGVERLPSLKRDAVGEVALNRLSTIWMCGGLMSCGATINLFVLDQGSVARLTSSWRHVLPATVRCESAFHSVRPTGGAEEEARFKTLSTLGSPRGVEDKPDLDRVFVESWPWVYMPDN